jgi:uncharacterized membrane-anchored protein YitT (DUF2179 family)
LPIADFVQRRLQNLIGDWRSGNQIHRSSLLFLQSAMGNRQLPIGNFMKLVSISIGSWLLGLAAILLTFYVVEGANLSAADVKGATVMSLIVAALLFSLAYAPSLFWLRRRLGGCRPAALFPLASALVLNLPVFLIGTLAIGRTLAPSEALAFIGAFILMGTAFGLGFVWNYQDRTI